MLRRSTRRCGHQLIKEPLHNEENTYARGRRTFHNTIHELQIAAGVSVVGVLVAWRAVRNASLRSPTVVAADGSFKRAD